MLFLGAASLGCGSSYKETLPRESDPPKARLLISIDGGRILVGSLIVINEKREIEGNLDVEAREGTADVEFSELSPGMKSLVFLSRGPQGSVSARIDLVPGHTRNVTLTLPAKRTLSGWVVDSQGNAVSGARVEFSIGESLSGTSHSERPRVISGGGGGTYGGIAGKATGSYHRRWGWSLTSDGRYTYDSTTTAAGRFYLTGLASQVVDLTVTHGKATVRYRASIGEEPTITLSEQ